MTSRISLNCAAALATLFALIAVSPRAAAADSSRQYYELRIYTTETADQQKRINDYWLNAAVPACNRMGIQPVGVFTELQDSATNKIYVLIPCDSVEIFAAIPQKLASDPAYQKAAADFLASTKTKPACAQIESSLLIAFQGMPHIVVSSADKRPNVFELRTYISPGESKGLNKIQMFESGEIAVMKEVGLAPIFYGQTVIGSHLPSLVYMTSGENLAEHNKHWQKFSSAPVWKTLQSDPQYKDNMVGMIKILLKRTPASQI